MSLARTSGAKLLLAAAVTAAMAFSLVSLPARPAQAQIDLTGTWNIQLAGSIDASCNPSAIKQNGESVVIGLPCLPLDLFIGSIDKATGSFSVSVMFFCDHVDVPFDMSGVASGDGNSISGSYNSICPVIGSPSGTFSGQRTGAATLTLVGPTLTPPPPSQTPPPPVGGIAFDPDVSTMALETPEPSSSNTGLLVGIAAAVASGVGALSGAAWYARRRVIS